MMTQTRRGDAHLDGVAVLHVDVDVEHPRVVPESRHPIPHSVARSVGTRTRPRSSGDLLALKSERVRSWVRSAACVVHPLTVRVTMAPSPTPPDQAKQTERGIGCSTLGSNTDGYRRNI